MDHEAARRASLEACLVQFGAAWAAGDAATLDALLSPTYTHTDASGELLRRDEWLTYVAGRAGRSTQIAFRDVETRILGDVAVVVGVNSIAGAGVRNSQDRAPLTLRFSQVWRFLDGRWLREAFQATPCLETVKFD